MQALANGSKVEMSRKTTPISTNASRLPMLSPPIDITAVAGGSDLHIPDRAGGVGRV